MMMEAAQQARSMGLKVGDTIRGREEYGAGQWSEAQLTLLWLGDEVAVWLERNRSNLSPEWADHGEAANWTLDCRTWSKVTPAVD